MFMFMCGVMISVCVGVYNYTLMYEVHDCKWGFISSHVWVYMFMRGVMILVYVGVYNYMLMYGVHDCRWGLILVCTYV